VGAGRGDDVALAGLSGREQEVARLVRDRFTNAQIAAQLFLSQKTVESHMANIMRKLGVSSRVDVARLVEREERAAP
jgi:DNA-binding NarL/FixJ family response regulator